MDWNMQNSIQDYNMRNLMFQMTKFFKRLGHVHHKMTLFSYKIL